MLRRKVSKLAGRTRGPAGLVLAVLVVLCTGLSGCGYILHQLAPASKGEWVVPANEALSEGKRVLVLVYAETAIQYQNDQLARYNTAAAVAGEMQSKLKVDAVEPAIVETFQANNIEWTDSHPSQIGQRFHADLVLYIELQEFTTIAEQSGELLRGRITGNCSLYNVGKPDAEAVKLLWEEQIKTVYPPNMPVVADIGVMDQIRRETFRLFAEKLVKNFYGHYEPY